MQNMLPPWEGLPSPESQSGKTLAPPFGGAFFIAASPDEMPSFYLPLNNAKNMSRMLTYLFVQAYRLRRICTMCSSVFSGKRQLSLKGFAQLFPERTTCPAYVAGLFCFCSREGCAIILQKTGQEP
jgi:hypothetical protein